MERPSRLRFWAWPWELRRRGVLGINGRNIALTNELNPRRRYSYVDDKLLTKALCEARGIAVPRTFAVVERLGEIRHLDGLFARCGEFVVKPARGAAGRGIVVVERHDGGCFETSAGQTLTSAELRHHLSGVLSGLYSLGGRTDRAIVEERVRRHRVFEDIAVCGTPDVRVIVCRRRAVMAMLRLPTRESRGRANLHQGAVAAGVDLARGTTRGGVHHNRTVEVHPDTGRRVSGIEVPAWPEILRIACALAEALEMGYVGIDIVLDDERGPVVLEANARPGLAIQIANRRGLLDAVR